MLTRTTRERLVFTRPFTLAGTLRAQPAGTYLVETEEELLEGLSFPAYRRVGTTITREGAPAGAVVQAVGVDPEDLARAHAADTA
jgi:hypothetical protein